MKQQVLPFDLPWRYMPIGRVYEELDAELLKRLDEDLRIEKKSPGISRESIAQYVSMWANTAPDGGIIIIGVEDKTGKILGCRSAEVARLNRLEKAGFELCPLAVCEVKHVDVINHLGEEDYVIAFRVHFHNSRVVRTAAGEAFVRRGDSKTKLSEEEIRIFEADKGQIEIEREDCSAPYPAEYDLRAIDDFVAAACKRKEWPNDRAREEVLALLNLGRFAGGQFVPNLACLLLFGQNPRNHIFGCRIRFLRIEGVTERTGESMNKVKEIFIDGNIPSIIVGAEQVLGSQLREFERLGSDGRFIVGSEYPKLAWYEAIVNACAHRSYLLKNMPIFVKMFDDRLEIESPGGFMPLVTPENIYDVHNPRNPWLMESMYYLRYVQCPHEGTRRMRQLMEESDLPAPEFAQKEIGYAAVRVTLRNSINQREIWRDTDVAINIVGRDVWAKLSVPERRILNCVAEHGRVNTKTAHELAGVRWHRAKKVLDGLVAMGLLVRKSRFSRDSKAHYIFPEAKPPV